MNKIYGANIRLGGTNFIPIFDANYYSKQYDIIFKINEAIEIIENNHGFKKEILIETFNKFYSIKKTNNKKNNKKIKTAIYFYILEN